MVIYCKTENLVYVSYVTCSHEWLSYNKLKHPSIYYPSTSLPLNPITLCNVVYVPFVTYSDKWTLYSVNMIADFYWMLGRESVEDSKKRKQNPLHRSFDNKRIRKSKRSWSICYTERLFVRMNHKSELYFSMISFQEEANWVCVSEIKIVVFKRRT